jgi:RNA polymerase sigma factor (sigma-70 family)
MPNAPLKYVLDHLRVAARPQEADGQLLDRFVRSRDEVAFETLVRRHGPMVLGVCRRLLLTAEDAEDAFQATFLILATKAASVRPRQRVGAWLHGVAYLAARKTKATTTRRHAREKQVRSLPEPATVADGLWNDLAPLLDQEVAHLPEKYRLPIVLCDLEGKTRAEAARELSWPEGTVAGRLARARALLAKRLTRLGLPLSAGVLTAVLAQNASASVPLTLVEQAARRTASGPVLALVEGVLKAVLLTKWKLTSALVLALALMAGAGVLVSRGSPVMPRDEPPQAAEPPVKQDAGPPADQGAERAEAKEEVAWGEAVGGLQAGLVFPAEGRLSCRVGEKVAFAVKVRNVSQVPAKVHYYSNVMRETPATVEDAAGKAVSVAMPPQKLYKRVLTSRTLEAGEAFDLGTQELTVAADGMDGEFEVPTLVAGPGWYRVSYDGVAFTRDSGDDRRPLSTGRVSLMVREKDSADAAWGKAVDGLQAGVAFRKGQRRPYGLGEAVTLVVWVRNVGDKPLTFDYTDGYMVEKPPTVKDADGKPARLSPFPILGGLWRPLHATLKPGEEFELGALRLALQEVGKKDAKVPTLYASPGKYRVRYEGLQPFGYGDPAKVLSTGEIELEVKEKADEVAWGEAVGGLQAGIAYRKGEKGVYSMEQTATFVVKVRNVSKAPIELSYGSNLFAETVLTVEDSRGKTLPAHPGADRLGYRTVLHQTLAAGAEVEFGDFPEAVKDFSPLALRLLPGDPPGQVYAGEMFVVPGRYKVGYTGLKFREQTAELLSTGKLDLDVRAKSDLEGSWKATSFEQDGRALPEEKVKEIEATFGGDGYRFTSGLRAAGSLTGTFIWDPDAKPKSLDLVPKEGVFKGESFKGIYKVEGDSLTLCLVWPTKERPKEFVSPPNSTAVLAVFKRQKP